ncbi:hypothetical protein [Crateriforma conspicua]|uniref:hypothetical protein n=1 Tax=Crateriforma conspicua TaxID=2527996 RepID=UPI0011899D92|nr:hypothetical protein [Crateriforma conspicua]QDV62020.1 hypothetical protein Mal65_11480 [Crateriforma conspicua]
MAERRSINEALNLTPEKLAFIKQDPRLEAVKDRDAKTIDLDQSKEIKESSKAQPEPVEPAAAKATPRREMRRTKRTTAQPTLSGGALVPLTTRLQPETADALRRAYLERKLDGFTNATQQEIVEEALQAWLVNEGYLSDAA